MDGEHKRQHPRQYNHPLCGKRVNVVTFKGPQTTGIVERVVASRFGSLATLEGTEREAWLVKDCHEQKG